MDKDTQYAEIKKIHSLNTQVNPETTEPMRPGRYMIDLAAEIPDPEPVITVNGIPVVSLGNIMCGKGKQKYGV